MNNKMITIPYADAIEYGENTSALFKTLWELTDLIRLESDLKKHHRRSQRCPRKHHVWQHHQAD